MVLRGTEGAQAALERRDNPGVDVQLVGRATIGGWRPRSASALAEDTQVLCNVVLKGGRMIRYINQ